MDNSNDELLLKIEKLQEQRICRRSLWTLLALGVVDVASLIDFPFSSLTNSFNILTGILIFGCIFLSWAIFKSFRIWQRMQPFGTEDRRFLAESERNLYNSSAYEFSHNIPLVILILGYTAWLFLICLGGWCFGQPFFLGQLNAILLLLCLAALNFKYIKIGDCAIEYFSASTCLSRKILPLSRVKYFRISVSGILAKYKEYYLACYDENKKKLLKMKIAGRYREEACEKVVNLLTEKGISQIDKGVLNRAAWWSFINNLVITGVLLVMLLVFPFCFASLLAFILIIGVLVPICASQWEKLK